MKKNDLIRVIREIVKQEIKKELPNALSQVFSNLMGGQPPVVHGINTVRPIASTPPAPSMPPEEEVDETFALKEQLREMFSGGLPVTRNRPQPQQAIQHQPQQRSPVQFTKNPVFNEILNQTRPFNSSEKMAMRVGGGGYGGMSPSVAMAASSMGVGMNSPIESPTTVGVGEMMSDAELGFTRNIPGMPGADGAMLTELPPASRQVLQEGQEGGAAPMEALGEVSALDVRNHPALPDSIKGILNRDYRSLVRAMDKRK